jgi:hypothetical protein
MFEWRGLHNIHPRICGRTYGTPWGYTLGSTRSPYNTRRRTHAGHAWEDIIITRHEYNCTEWSNTMIDGRTHATRMDGYIYMDDRGSHRRLGSRDRLVRLNENTCYTHEQLYLQSHMGHMWRPCGPRQEHTLDKMEATHEHFVLGYI